MNQHQALANLHKVVQICNSGIDINQIKQNQQKLNPGSSFEYNQGQQIQLVEKPKFKAPANINENSMK